MSDPECRNVATKAHATLLRLVKDVDAEPPKAADAQVLYLALALAIGMQGLERQLPAIAGERDTGAAAVCGTFKACVMYAMGGSEGAKHR